MDSVSHIGNHGIGFLTRTCARKALHYQLQKPFSESKIVQWYGSWCALEVNARFASSEERLWQSPSMTSSKLRPRASSAPSMRGKRGKKSRTKSGSVLSAWYAQASSSTSGFAVEGFLFPSSR